MFMECSPDDLSGCPATGSIAAVGSIVVVEAKVALQRAVEVAELGEIASPELDPPVLVEDRALKTLHEAVGEGVARLRPRVPDLAIFAGLVELGLELTPAIGEHAFHAPAGFVKVLGHAVEELGGHGSPGVSQKEHGQAVGGSGIAGRDLPDLADALEPANEEAVERLSIIWGWRLRNVA